MGWRRGEGRERAGGKVEGGICGGGDETHEYPEHITHLKHPPKLPDLAKPLSSVTQEVGSATGLVAVAVVAVEPSFTCCCFDSSTASMGP